MDKETLSKLVWLVFLICCGLAFWSNIKAWSSGEVTRSRSGSSNYRKFTREDNPSEFQRYMLGMFFLNAIFFFALILWGIFAFLR